MASTTVREGRAVAKFVPMSASKVRRSADLIRRKPLQEARRVLAFNPQRGAKALWKVLESAVANAVNNADLDESTLFVHTVFVDDGPFFKRGRPRAQGRQTLVRRRRCHINVTVRPMNQQEEA